MEVVTHLRVKLEPQDTSHQPPATSHQTLETNHQRLAALNCSVANIHPLNSYHGQ